MARSKTSRQWLKAHFSDPFVIKAQQQGYRSRAVFKLMEIQQKDAIVKPGMTVIDLGAAPGGWCQLLTKWTGKNGRVIALDILPIVPIENSSNIDYVQGDFREAHIFQLLLDKIYQHQQKKADIIVSDLAPNSSGMKGVDQPRAMYLAELSLELAQKILKTDGSLVIKVFQGEGYDDFLKKLRQFFKKVWIRKPQASRAHSRENYLVAKNFMI